ncbi:hypothetical protein L0U85_15780 [Glycomyces sp. L485]|uniref:Rv1678 family membrane protein n=1 Tax=Glycomyces sp. L485 TaxID=2909235 RepID=UPI001F4B292A|nr:hypothetical protein [Glycomyces sp. L485]MCH7232304.1 hypothetical protein [Glycomyces sp. L485]
MTTTHDLDRAALTFGLASLASLVFVFEGLDEFRFMTVGGPAAAIAVVLGGLAVAAGLTGIRVLALLAGLGFGTVAVLQLVATATGGDWLGGNLSTMAFWLGLAVGLLVIGTAPNVTAAAAEGN